LEDYHSLCAERNNPVDDSRLHVGQNEIGTLLTDWVKQLLQNKPAPGEYQKGTSLSFTERIPAITHEAFGIVKSVSLYIVLGVAIGGLLHGYIPTGFFETYISKDNPLAVPIA